MINSKNLLYRYRSVTEYSIKELIEDSLVFSTADTFNDPTDIALSYNPIDYTTELVAFKTMENIVPPGYLNMPKVKEMTSLYFDHQINDMIDNFKKNVIIGCFSKECGNPVMWSHYAGNRTGFVLGYSYNEVDSIVKNNLKDKGELVEVEYSGEKVTIHKEAIELINSSASFEDGITLMDTKLSQSQFNSLLIKDDKYKKAFYTKDKPWEYEKEVRYIAYNNSNNKQSHIRIGKCKPKVIILGDRLSTKDKYLLLSIAREKGFEVFELMLSYRTDNCGLTPVYIDKEEIDNYLKTNDYGFVMHPSLVPHS